MKRIWQQVVAWTKIVLTGIAIIAIVVFLFWLDKVRFIY